MEISPQNPLCWVAPAKEALENGLSLDCKNIFLLSLPEKNENGKRGYSVCRVLKKVVTIVTMGFSMLFLVFSRFFPYISQLKKRGIIWILASSVFVF